MQLAYHIFVGNVDQDKVLLVRQGGTLELHGPKKLSWTKLAETATKFKEVPDVLDDKVSYFKTSLTDRD